MFKNLTVLNLVTLPENLEEKLSKAAFVPCSPTESFSDGWQVTREGQFCYAYGEVMQLTYVSESKSVPASALKARLDEMVAKTTEAQGYSPGRKATKDLKEAATDELLARALPTTKKVSIILAPKSKLILVDSASPAQVDAIASKLLRTSSVALGHIHTVKQPSELMTQWVLGTNVPLEFEACEEAQLVCSATRTDQVISFKATDLSDAKIKDYIAQGMQVSKLALIKDGELSFTLTDLRQYKNLASSVKPEYAENDNADDMFHADLVLTTLNLTALHTAIIEQLGGVQPA